MEREGVEGRRETRLAQFRILEAQRATEEAVTFLRRLRDRSIPLGDVSDFIMTFWPSSKQKETVLSYIQRLQLTEGDLSEEDLGAIDYNSRLLIPLKLESLDSLTSIAATRVVSEAQGRESWHLYASDILLANFGKGGERAFAYCVGRPNSGKTNVGMLAIQEALRKGWDAISNIHIHGIPPGGLHHENRLSGVLRILAERRLSETPSFVTLDEGGLWWLRSQAQRKESQGLDKVARVIGKLDATLWFIEQRERSVPTTVMSFARSAFYCGPPGVVRIEHRGPVHFYRSLRDVPKTRIRYDPQDISYLAYDLDVDSLFSQVGNIKGGGVAQAQGILRYLDGEREVDREQKRYTVYAMADTGKLSQREIAKGVGVSQQTVSRWLSGRIPDSQASDS
ncbi:MAG: helix-turn-helix domain-containing protein [Thermoplasmata archaeon]